MEGSTFTDFALKPDFSALHFDQVLGDIQAQACARGLAFRHFGAEILLENFALVFGRNTNAGITHPEVHHWQ